MNKRRSTKNLEVELRNIGEGYVIVRQRAPDGLLAAPLDGRPGLYIPFEFEAGLFTPGLPEVWLKLKAAWALRTRMGTAATARAAPAASNVRVRVERVMATFRDGGRRDTPRRRSLALTTPRGPQKPVVRALSHVVPRREGLRQGMSMSAPRGC